MSGTYSFWRDKECVVTGGLGFVGSHLSKRLRDLGARVVVIDKEPAIEGTLFPLLNRAADFDITHLDLAQPTAVGVLCATSADYVFHLAALPYAPYTTKHPHEAYAANVVSTVNVLEAARLGAASRVVLASSACVFGAAQRSPLRVGDPPYVPEHYYSITKQDAEKQVHAFHQWYGTEAVICRLGNVYGPGDRHFGRIIPQICHQLINEHRDELRLLRSTGESVFEFIYIDDVVNAFLQAAESPSDIVETYQFSSGEQSRCSIRELAGIISQEFDGKPRVVTGRKSGSEKTVQKYLDTGATQMALQWKPVVELAAGLRSTVDWYKAHINSVTPFPDA